jgi:hypothetical protein
MTTTTRYPCAAPLLASLVLLAAAPAAAQHPARAPAPAAHPTPSIAAQPAQPHTPEAERAERADNLKSFRGISSKLNTTPEALESAYEAAKQANPKLTRGQFIAANVLAQNLGAKHPGITTAAILDGLKSGKSIGQTLHSLGLSAAEAKEAERAADREVREAEKAEKAEKAAQAPKTDSH